MNSQSSHRENQLCSTAENRNADEGLPVRDQEGRSLSHMKISPNSWKQRSTHDDFLIATSLNRFVVGLDLGDGWSRFCVLESNGEIQHEDRVRSTGQALKECFGTMPPVRFVIETGRRSHQREDAREMALVK